MACIAYGPLWRDNPFMKRSVASFVAFFVVFAASSGLCAQSKQPAFVAAAITTASDINYPITSIASGIVVVAVHLDGSGKIKDTEVLRDVPSLTAPVLLAIKRDWTFKPATLDGKPVSSTIVVNIVFNPFEYRLGGPATPVLGKELKVLALDENGFLPPLTTAGAWAEYPPNSTAQGSVILDVRVSRTGRVTRAIDVYRIPSVTTPSIDAAQKWTFKPATLNGSRIAANAVIGYVFRLPNISSPVAQP